MTHGSAGVGANCGMVPVKRGGETWWCGCLVERMVVSGELRSRGGCLWRRFCAGVGLAIKKKEQSACTVGGSVPGVGGKENWSKKKK